MVWRDNIKVLGIKTKILPLVFSMLLHVVVLLVFATANHERERIFTKESPAEPALDTPETKDMDIQKSEPLPVAENPSLCYRYKKNA